MAVSANVMQGEPERCVAAGMDDFVPKPTTIPFLGGKLRRWLPHLVWPSAPPVPGADGDTPGDEDVAVTNGAIDHAVLDELTGGDPEFAAEVMLDFVETTRADIEALQVALIADDLDVVRRQAHRVKGASRTVGARRLAHLAEELESLAGDDGDRSEMRRLADDLLAALTSVVAGPS